MKISIIVPTIREEKLLDFQLPYFANQTFNKEDFEVIIVDDLMKDRSDTIKEFGKKSGMNIKWMRNKKPHWRCNANIGCARNTGLIHAEGELVVFIDDFSCIRSRYLENIWNIYNKDKGRSHIGPVTSVRCNDSVFGQYTDDRIKELDRICEDGRSRVFIEKFYGLSDVYRSKAYDDKRVEMDICHAGWFYTSNASAPLNKIIEINGFWELADLTREEDILMGLALDRLGHKFCFVNGEDVSVYHVTHDIIKKEDVKSICKMYKEVTYEDIGWPTVDIDGRMVAGGGRGGGGSGVGGICGLNTNSDSIQLVTKDIYNTRYPGSWALIEEFNRNKNLKFNAEFGFDLKEERKKIGL